MCLFYILRFDYHITTLDYYKPQATSHKHDVILNRIIYFTTYSSK